MSELKYTSVNRILSKIYRDLKGITLNESDAIEWIGEALEFLNVFEVQEQAVLFMEVKNYETDLPTGFQMVLQIAKYNDWSFENKKDCCISTKIEEKIEEKSDCGCKSEKTFPFKFDWQYITWISNDYYKQYFTPIRLSNNVFFNSLVCEEKNKSIYQTCEDEYTIVGTTSKKLRFSFKEGYIALAYIKNVIDKETGYPLIPEDIRYISAITYYIKWKIAEMYSWNGRQGFANLAKESEKKWLEYQRKAKNYMKMPKTIDQFQNLLEQSHYLIPRHKRYYGYFGNLGKEESRKFNNPTHRRKVDYGE